MSAKSIREGDIVCLLQGASKPPIIGQHKDHFAIVVIAATLHDSGNWEQLELSKSMTDLPRDFLFVWDWEQPLRESQDREEYETLAATNDLDLKRLKANLGDNLVKATRTWNVGLILGDLREHEMATGMF